MFILILARIKLFCFIENYKLKKLILKYALVEVRVYQQNMCIVNIIQNFTHDV